MALVVYTGILTSHRDWTTAVKCAPLVPELSNILPKVVGYPFTIKSECASASEGKDKAKGCDDADLSSEECSFEFVVPKAPLPDVGLISASRDTTILTWKRPEVVAAARAQHHRHLNQAKKQSAIERHVKRNKKIASPLSLLSFASTDEENAAAAALSKSAPVYTSKEGQNYLTVVPVRSEASSREEKQLNVSGAAVRSGQRTDLENGMPQREQMASREEEEEEYTAGGNDNNNRIKNNRSSLPHSSVGRGNATGASAAKTANYNNNCTYDANGGKAEVTAVVGSSSLASAENTMVKIITSPSGEGLGFVSERLTSAPSKRSIKTAAAVHGIDLSSSSTRSGGKVTVPTTIVTGGGGGRQSDSSDITAASTYMYDSSSMPLPSSSSSVMMSLSTHPSSSSSLPPSSIHAKPFVPTGSGSVVRSQQKRATDVATATATATAAAVLSSPSKRIPTQEWRATEHSVEERLSGTATTAASQRRSSNAPSASASSTTCAMGVDTTRATRKKNAGKHISSSSTAPTRSNASSSTATTAAAQQQLPFLQAGNRYEVHSGFVSDLALSNKVYTSSKRAHVLWRSDDEEGYKLPPPTRRGAVNTHSSGLTDTCNRKASVGDNIESGALSTAGKVVEGSQLVVVVGGGIASDVGGGAEEDHRSPPPSLVHAVRATRSTEHEERKVAAAAASADATQRGAMNPNGKSSTPSSPSSQSFTVSSSSSNDRGTNNSANLATQEQILAASGVGVAAAAAAVGHQPFYPAYTHYPSVSTAFSVAAAPPLPPPPYSPHLPLTVPIPPLRTQQQGSPPLRFAASRSKINDNSTNKTSLPLSSSSPKPAATTTPYPQGKYMYYLAASASWDKSIRIMSIPYSELAASDASVAYTRTITPRLHGGGEGDEDGVVDSDNDEEEAVDSSAQQLLRVPVTLRRHGGSALAAKSGGASGETQSRKDGDGTANTSFVPSSFPLPLSRISGTPLVEYRPIPKIAATEKKLLGHSGDVLSVSFSPDDRLLASGGRDAVLKLWSVETGECLWSSPSTKGAGGVGGSGVSVAAGAPTYASVLSRNVQSAPLAAAESSSSDVDHSQLFVDCWVSPTKQQTDQSSHTHKKLRAADNTTGGDCSSRTVPPPHQHQHHAHTDWISVVCFSPKAVDTVITSSSPSSAEAANGGRSSGRKGDGHHNEASKRTTSTTTTTATTVTQLFSLVSASWDGTVCVWSVKYTRACSSSSIACTSCPSAAAELGAASSSISTKHHTSAREKDEENVAKQDVRETVSVTCRYVYRGFSSSSTTSSVLAAKQRGSRDLGEKASTVPVTALTISPDGSLCAAGSKLGSVHMLDLATIVERTFPPRGYPPSFSSSGASTLSAGGGGGLVIPTHHRSLPSDAEVLCFTLGVTSSETLSSSSSSSSSSPMITQLAFSPKYFWLTVATEAGHLSIYDLERAVSLADLIPEMLSSTTSSGGGGKDGEGGGGGGGFKSKIKVMRRPTCTSVCWSRDGSYLFSGYTDNTIRVWTVLPTPSSTSAVDALTD